MCQKFKKPGQAFLLRFYHSSKNYQNWNSYARYFTHYLLWYLPYLNTYFTFLRVNGLWYPILIEKCTFDRCINIFSFLDYNFRAYLLPLPASLPGKISIFEKWYRTSAYLFVFVVRYFQFFLPKGIRLIFEAVICCALVRTSFIPDHVFVKKYYVRSC